MFRLVISVLLTALASATAQAQLGIAEIAYAGHKVKDILGDAEGRANTLMNNARLQSNLVFADAGNQLQVMTKNIQYLLSSEREKTFEQLDDSERNLLGGLNEIIKAANDQTNKIEKMADFVSLDVDRYLQRLPGAEKHPFYIRRVDNLVLRQQKLPYIVRIRGMGFGQPS